MRGQAPSSRDLRRERLAGNWGGASEHIGRRWEEVGLQRLQARVESREPWPSAGFRAVKIVELAGTGQLETALSKAGLPNADVIMVLESDDGGGQALQALDFKWNLEFASYGQIRAEAIGALLKKGLAPLKSALGKATDETPDHLPVLDGLLCSPNLPVNLWFLDSEENGKQEYPIERHEVIFEDVEASRFFGPLPGWEMAARLAQIDRSQSRLHTLDGAEHYYRLGAGLQGGVSQLLVSVFVRQPPPVGAAEAFEWLRGRARPPSSMAFLQQMERLMTARAQLQTRLRNVTRSPYRFSDLAEMLKARGIKLPERENELRPSERARWGDLLRKVGVEHKELIYRTGQRLVEAGLSDAEALTRLEGDARRFAERARSHAELLAGAQVLGIGGMVHPPNP